MKSLNIKRNKGFALLFSVLISSLLLTIGLSILSIALKELDISSATERSIHAFYAADSGVECVKYWDLKTPRIPKPDTDLDRNGRIVCGSFDSTTTGLELSYDSSSRLIENFTDNISLLITEPDGPNFNLRVKRETATTTIVTANGRDTAGGDRVERAIEDTY